jgi:four helix bundle protein
MSTIATHRDLAAWREAMTLVELVYRHTEGFPGKEAYGLTAQLRRSAVSIPSNIAEGAGRNSTRELLQFLGFACGSLAELDTQLEVAARLGYLNVKSEVFDQAVRVGVLVRLFRKSIRSKSDEV